VKTTLRQALTFGAVGVVGYGVDAGVLHLFAPLLGPYLGRAASYLCAATTTFALNRRFTFGVRGRGRVVQQWAAFVTANLAGGAVNFAVYAAMIAAAPAPFDNPWIAVAAGSLAGMALNFTLSKRVVFRR
jgi:putative flippase GtrA